MLPTLELLNLSRGDADVAIRCGVPGWSDDLTCERLMAVTMTPVCSPEFLERVSGLKLPADVTAHTLIHADVEMADAGYEWRAWFNAARVPEPLSASGVSFHDPGLAMQAAVNGIGIAMGYVELIQQDIAAGRLVCPFDVTALHPYSYFLVYAESRTHEASIAGFRDWIFSEVETCGRPPESP